MGTGEHINYVYGLTASAFAGYKEATSHQEAKIKALVEALGAYGGIYTSDTSVREQANLAIAAAKETP